ncbi:CRISPR-associated protein Cmr3 [Euhalothece natronophila Z-M001]|uniref:CRISPR-associated protein Cmr3 n=1 Tax=Euhalothece natronophila Z-M001 TaxID=522448 RepID=A0A5B8NI71_9CHRO|nr:type III-B CRISPR module-associated Cmr3 family protein [Euhalothece natronophila]QDZ38902.1 CRISPR-associated protein Cmr3 [Euhalothece natronophila Z-M001]
MSLTFQYLITIEPLGFLYGSAGRFLSPENLVGRSGTSFPPSSATLSGLYAANQEDINALIVAGPFWSEIQNPQNFRVPLPHNYLVKDQQIQHQLQWNHQQWETENGTSPTGKFDKGGGWITIDQWHSPQQVESDPWEYLPHLHPRLKTEERKVEADSDQGSLFLENAVQLDPEACLVYLSNTHLDNGWYRFGGEGHFVNLRCLPLDAETQTLLHQPCGKQFALITPAVWGSNRYSYRFPILPNQQEVTPAWSIETLLTERPQAFRYRLGGDKQAKRLSRGRYAVPAGSVYVLSEPLEPWENWEESWFPKEAYSFKRWGCGLSLPLAIGGKS